MELPPAETAAEFNSEKGIAGELLPDGWEHC
jgi:hypothetical protein